MIRALPVGGIRGGAENEYLARRRLP